MKNFVIDTNVLLQDPQAIFSFDEHTVIIPIGVIEELDDFKKDQGELGRNSREVSRELDKLRKVGDLRAGVESGFGGKIRVVYNGSLGTYIREKNVDYHVLHMAEMVKTEFPDQECIVVSNDLNVRLKANALGINSDGYDNGTVCDKKILDDGYREVHIDRKAYGTLVLRNEIDIEKIFDDDDLPYPHCYLLVHGPDEKQKVMAKVRFDRTSVDLVPDPPDKLPIKSQNIEQAFALDALLDPDIDLVCLVGRAGSGKTLLATVAGVHQVEDRNYFEKMLISRPIMPMGKDIGFLPGDIQEKLDPWMKPIYDALEIIHKNVNPEKKNSNKSQKDKVVDGKKIAENSGNIFIEPLTYIRGRSIHGQYVLIDEAQNLTSLELKTILSRAGMGTKIVLTGDIQQIDNPYVDSRSNGLSVVIDAFRDSECAAHIVLKDGVRSRLSAEATERL